MRHVTLVALMIGTVALSPAHAREVDTVASSKVQESFWGLFGYPKSLQCRPTKPSVVSSKQLPGVQIDKSVLVAGEVDEVWQSNVCGTKVYYLIRFGPGKDGEVRVIGAERTFAP